jgi:RNA polymerase sigma factor for flagellar operon FliA
VARPVLLAPFMKMTTATARTKARPAKTTANVAPKPRAKRARVSVARRNEYVTKYYTCVEKVARRLARRLPSHVDIDDLMSAGAVGLIEAAERFNPGLGNRFETFAEARIRGAILDDLRARDTLSRDMRRISNELRVAANAAANQLGRTPTEDEVADHMGVGVDEIRARRMKLSGSSVIGLEDADPSFWEHAADESADDPAEQATRRELFAYLVSQIQELPEKMQQVLSLYYRDGLNMKEIGTVLGVTESRVCQLHGEAARRLRTMLDPDLFADVAA